MVCKSGPAWPVVTVREAITLIGSQEMNLKSELSAATQYHTKCLDQDYKIQHHGIVLDVVEVVLQLLARVLH
jgi:hypothetical protein